MNIFMNENLVDSFSIFVDRQRFKCLIVYNFESIFFHGSLENIDVSEKMQRKLFKIEIHLSI